MLLPSPPKNWAPNGENRSESDGGKLALVAQVKNFQIGLNVQNAVLYSGAARQFFFSRLVVERAAIKIMASIGL